MSDNVTQKIEQLREDIRSLGEELIDDNAERANITEALAAANERIDAKRRLRLSAIAALTQLEQTKI